MNPVCVCLPFRKTFCIDGILLLDLHEFERTSVQKRPVGLSVACLGFCSTLAERRNGTIFYVTETNCTVLGTFLLILKKKKGTKHEPTKESESWLNKRVKHIFGLRGNFVMIL